MNSNNFYSSENGDVGDNVKNLINCNIVIFSDDPNNIKIENNKNNIG